MTIWTIQPRDPLIFRDGKPFGAAPGAHAKSLPFPYPSTIAGGVRTRAGQDESGRFVSQQIDNLLQLRLRGPMLVTLDEAGEIEDWYFPAPADCLVLQNGEPLKGKRLQVRPVQLTGAATNLEEGLRLVSVNPVIRQKPHKNTPRFWNWQILQEWLRQPADNAMPIDLPTLGISGLVQESRVHVSIDQQTGTAGEGLLFQTSGLEFCVTSQEGKQKLLSRFRQYALAVETDAGIEPGVGFLGGERRMVAWRQSIQTLPSCPNGIRQAIVVQKHCRLLLATPGIFAQGYLPTWVCENTSGLTVRVVAAAVPRYQAVSGWDAKEETTKPSRRLTPAGSVYFLSLEGEAQAIQRFVDDVWMNPVSDDEQDRRDGFGLALLGTWNGETQPLEVKE